MLLGWYYRDKKKQHNHKGLENNIKEGQGIHFPICLGSHFDWSHSVKLYFYSHSKLTELIPSSSFPYFFFSHSFPISIHRVSSPYFDDVDGIIFMAALSSFDQCCEEDERMNRMKECVVLFNSIANHKLFADTAFILFMNKIDVFQRKLDAGSLVKTHFSEYDGPNDYATASAFLHSRFLQQCKDTAKQIYTHFTHATVS